MNKERILNKKPLTIVIFGATGDLYQNKLAVALFDLFSRGMLPRDFKIIAFARRPFSDYEFQDITKKAIHKKYANKIEKEEDLERFLENVSYLQGDFTNGKHFEMLAKVLQIYDEDKKICTNKLFYLAVPPNFYAEIFKNIHSAGLAVPCVGKVDDNKSWTRILVEKPFGKNISEAKKLDAMLGKLFDESQIFRIDHYLAKETMQNLINFRFSNKVMESLWNHKKIEKVRVVLHESSLVGNRGAFYDGLGALLDVGQNHVLQMLALVAMDKPKLMDSVNVHTARTKILEKISISNSSKEKVLLRGQYAGYLDEGNVQPNSKTETFFRIVLNVNNSKWRGVPFVVESGKALARSEAFVEVCFHDLKYCLKFPVSHSDRVMRDAYEKVFYDAIVGDQTVFVSTKEIMAEWKIVTQITKKWQKIPLVIYEKGTKPEDMVRQAHYK